MAYDPDLARALREDLSDEAFTEMKMFGGLCFLSGGNMICGLHGGGTMYRVGKAGYAAALALPGVRAMTMGGRRMAAMVEMSPEDSADPDKRAAVLALAKAAVRPLPPKVAKPGKR